MNSSYPEAARSLAAALAALSSPRGPSHRDRHRQLLGRAILQGELALAGADALGEGADEARMRARAVLARAHAARAADALHGANQLSLSAQRAPTPEACDEGWQRVASLVAIAEQAARAASDAASDLSVDVHVSSAARAARAAAADADGIRRGARRLLDERNPAYTFHTDPGFSFGEGWYVAAAAVLAGVSVQIEPDKPGTAAAERFLREAGLGAQVRPFRPRPRANKQTTDSVARAFRADPAGAQRRLRAAFLGDAPVAAAVREWIDPRLSGRGGGPRVLLWVRNGSHHARRNTAGTEIVELSRLARAHGLTPVLVGDALRDGVVPEGAVDFLLFWTDAIFLGAGGRRAQLQFFEHLRAAHGVVGQIGVTTAGMDGPALMGMPTAYLTDAPNPRMGAWVGAVPGYREIVRDGRSQDRVNAALREWLAAGSAR
jgi:hypothetical protein